MKKITTSLVASMLLTTMVTTNVTEAATNTKSNKNNTQYAVAEESLNSKIYYFPNNSTLEEIQKNGERYFISKSKGEKQKIYKENNIVYVVDMKTDKVVSSYNIDDISYESVEVFEDAPESLNPIQTASNFNVTSSSNVGTYAVAIDPGSGSKYKYIKTVNLSFDIIGLSSTSVAGIMASLLGGPITGVITTIASAAVSYALPKLYWKKRMYAYTEGIYKYSQNVALYYKYYDYTGYLGTETMYSKTRIMY